jgi:phosphatidylglycerophosphatase A
MEVAIGTSDAPLPRPSWGSLLSDPLSLLAFGFGSGLSPIAPGTVGTLVAMAAMPLLAQLPLAAYLAWVLVAAAAGVWLCGHASRRLGVHDHPGIVWDEFAGYWLALVAVPAHWAWWLAGFVLFRLFDIVKPWPISVADRRLGGGFGIMLDDLLAGLMTWACLQLAMVFLP